MESNTIFGRHFIGNLAFLLVLKTVDSHGFLKLVCFVTSDFAFIFLRCNYTGKIQLKVVRQFTWYHTSWNCRFLMRVSVRQLMCLHSWFSQ